MSLPSSSWHRPAWLCSVALLAIPLACRGPGEDAEAGESEGVQATLQFDGKSNVEIALEIPTGELPESVDPVALLALWGGSISRGEPPEDLKGLFALVSPTYVMLPWSESGLTSAYDAGKGRYALRLELLFQPAQTGGPFRHRTYTALVAVPTERGGVPVHLAREDREVRGEDTIGTSFEGHVALLFQPPVSTALLFKQDYANVGVNVPKSEVPPGYLPKGWITVWSRSTDSGSDPSSSSGMELVDKRAMTLPVSIPNLTSRLDRTKGRHAVFYEVIFKPDPSYPNPFKNCRLEKYGKSFTMLKAGKSVATKLYSKGHVPVTCPN